MHVFRRRFSPKRRVRMKDSFVFSPRTSSLNVFRFFGSPLHPVHLPPFQSWLEAGFPRPPTCDHALTSLSARKRLYMGRVPRRARVSCLWISYFDRFSFRLFHTFSRNQSWNSIVVERRRRRIGKVKDIYALIITFLLSFYNCNYISIKWKLN